MRRGWFYVFPHRSDEAIASLGDGLDVFAAVLCITQHLPQSKDVPGQIAFLDEDTRPDFFEQLFFLDDVPRPFNQNEEGLQILWREGNGPAIAQQNLLDGIKAVGAEFE